MPSTVSKVKFTKAKYTYLLWAWLWSLVWIETVCVLVHSEVGKSVKLLVALVTPVWHLVLVQSNVFQKDIKLLEALTTRLDNTLVHLTHQSINQPTNRPTKQI